MSIRVKLLSVIGTCALCFVVFAAVSWNILNTTKVNGEWYYKIVQGKDLIADVLPPPEYIIEAYLIVFQMLEETNKDKLQGLMKESESLRKEYEGRHRFWETALKDEALKAEFLVNSYRSATKFFDIRDKEVIPAILRDDRDNAREVVKNSLKPLYAEHRRAIDKVVNMADKKLRAEEVKVQEIISSRTFLLCMLGLLVMGAISVCGIYMNHISSAVLGRISRVVSGLIEGADHVASAAGQVSSSSQSLAEGSSEQAASLEETSSSLEEMGSMTIQTANNAAQADSLMKEANQIVACAFESMEELTISMKEISRAGEETSKIIKTIDEIAFQTNLLALNAAVEAARAGEAGAGFAVVAGEVRNLALRAAEAAKNTTNLIEGTVKKVKDGEGLVDKTNQAFSEVTKSAGRVGALIAEISAASREQSQGIEQVSKAVAEMDKVVQQNAANAEENASASEEMNAQAIQMKGFVEGLKKIVGEARANHNTTTHPGATPRA